MPVRGRAIAPHSSASKQPARPSLAQGIGLGWIVQAWPMVGFGVCLAWCRVRALSFAARRVFLPAPYRRATSAGKARLASQHQAKGWASWALDRRTAQARTAAPAQASKSRAPWALQTVSKVQGIDSRAIIQSSISNISGPMR